MDTFLTDIAEWLVNTILDAFLAILRIIENGLLLTPDVTALPQLRALTTKAVLVVDTVYVLVFLTAGILTMTAGGNEKARYEVKALIPRAIVGFVAAHFSPLFVGKLIEVANAFIRAIAGEKFDRDGAVAAIARLVKAAGKNPAQPVLTAILIGIIVVLLASTVFGLITRVAVLLVLAMLGPFALACYGLPQTERVAVLWWQSIGGCLLTPMVQAFCLQAGAWLLLDPAAMLPFLSIGGDPLQTANLMVVIVLLYATVKVPKLVKQYLVRGAPPHNLVTAVLRTTVVQQGARVIGIPATLRGGK
ncbi:hypothetical protein Val02_62820 [Virgisporangium aliadipatigenens]|uniref:Uncharacterized protein n=1 Tax=Virgisporangium aliadipatigenens TaxID=741659 RepID=A0A8J3YQ70_9ACTN|nr:conjugal transfer protein TrbL family protein [Virgisporangium aliadipatigenens]GIJ49396.1 hypothetical protein Val02_62820 [Virgisporangium aliadipatigenens]